MTPNGSRGARLEDIQIWPNGSDRIQKSNNVTEGTAGRMTPNGSRRARLQEIWPNGSDRFQGSNNVREGTAGRTTPNGSKRAKLEMIRIWPNGSDRFQRSNNVRKATAGRMTPNRSRRARLEGSGFGRTAPIGFREAKTLETVLQAGRLIRTVVEERGWRRYGVAERLRSV